MISFSLLIPGVCGDKLGTRNYIRYEKRPVPRRTKNMVSIINFFLFPWLPRLNEKSIEQLGPNANWSCVLCFQFFFLTRTLEITNITVIGDYTTIFDNMVTRSLFKLE